MCSSQPSCLVLTVCLRTTSRAIRNLIYSWLVFELYCLSREIDELIVDESSSSLDGTWIKYESCAAGERLLQEEYIIYRIVVPIQDLTGNVAPLRSSRRHIIHSGRSSQRWQNRRRTSIRNDRFYGRFGQDCDTTK